MKNEILNDKEKPWGKKISWLIGVVGLIATIVFGFISLFDKDEPKLEYDIISATDLFNTPDSASYIKVYIEDSIDVHEKHLNITTYSIRIENKGSKHISYHDYDEGFFGLRIDNGTLLEVPLLISASNDHIEKNFHTDTTSKGRSEINIPKLSLDIKENYVIKIVLLRNIDSIPMFYPEGKIIGQKNIAINQILKSDLSIWKELFDGNWLVQIVRFFSYLTVIMLLLLLIDTIDTAIEKKEYEKRNKQRKEKELKQREKAIEQKEEEISEISTIIPIVKEEYINNGYASISYLDTIYRYNDELKVTEKYRRMSRFIMNEKNNVTEEEYARVKEEFEKYNYYIEKKFFILNEDLSITFNKEAKLSTIELYRFLNDKRQATNRYRTVNEILNI